MTLAFPTVGAASFTTVGVIGAGTMGAGIAQVAAQAGCRVKLYDARDGAAQAALVRTSDALTKLADKGKLSIDADPIKKRISY